LEFYDVPLWFPSNLKSHFLIDEDNGERINITGFFIKDQQGGAYPFGCGAVTAHSGCRAGDLAIQAGGIHRSGMMPGADDGLVQ